MKLKIRSLVIVLVLVCVLTSQAFAITFYYRASSGYDLIWSDDFLVAEILDLLFTQEFTAICDATPYASSYTYKVVVSYDELAGLVTTANTHQLNTSLYRNDAAGYWVAKVHDFDGNLWFTNDNTPRVLGNPNGYVYVAEIDTTGEDMVSLLDSILVRLTLVESYVKSAYFELWEQGGVLDGIYNILNRVGPALEDVRSRLYYNGQSAAYYLYKIESHLATIAGNSGSSGSSSGTDLSGVLQSLDTISIKLGSLDDHLANMDAAFELLNIYQDLLYKLVHAMETDTEKLSDIDNTLDSIDTRLETTNSHLSVISVDIYDILKELQAEGAFSTDISGILTAMESVITKLGALDTSLSTTNTHLSGIGSDIGSILKLLQQNGAFTTDISGVLADLETIIGNQSSALPVLQGMSDSLEMIAKRLSYSDTSIGYYVYRINNFLRYDFVEKLDTIIDLLDDEGSATTTQNYVYELLCLMTEIYSGLGLEGIDVNLTGIPAIMLAQEEMIELLTNISDVLSADGYIGDELHDIGVYTQQLYIKLGAFQEQQNTLVDTISKSLKHNNYSVAYYVWALGGLVERSFESVLANQSTALPVLQSMSESFDMIIALLQQDGAFTTDLTGVLTDLENVIGNQGSVLSVQQQILELLSSIDNSLTYSDSGVGRRLYLLNSNLLSKTNELISNQEELLALLQQDGIFTTDISGVLANQIASNTIQNLISENLSYVRKVAEYDFYYLREDVAQLSYDFFVFSSSLLGWLTNENDGSSLVYKLNVMIEFMYTAEGCLLNIVRTLSNIEDALPQMQSMNESLSTIKDRLYYVDASISYYVYAVNKKMSEQLPVIIANQEAILSLLQQEGAFTTDLSGVLADLDAVINNQGAALPVLQSVSETISSIDESLNYGSYGIGYRLYSMNNKFTTMIENQEKLIDLIEDLELTTNVTIENIENITIDVTNKAYEVFYITDSEGNEQNLADFSGDVLTISGRLLNFFFKVAFDDAMDSVDSALDDMTEFYIDDSVLVGGGSLWE